MKRTRAPRKDNTPTDPVGWRERAAERGWIRDPHKRLDMDTFAETIAAVPSERLRGVRVGYMKLEAWWTVDAALQGVGCDGLTHERVFARTLATALHHVPKAVSLQVTRIPDERTWCPGHAFKCGATTDRSCGYDCRRTRDCFCSQCTQIIDPKISVEKRLGLVFYPQSKDEEKVALPTREKLTKRANNKLAKPQKKPKKPKDHLLPGQVGLLQPPR